MEIWTNQELFQEQKEKAIKVGNSNGMVAVVTVTKVKKSTWYEFHFEKAGSVKVGDIQELEDGTVRRIEWINEEINIIDVVEKVETIKAKFFDERGVHHATKTDTNKSVTVPVAEAVRDMIRIGVTTIDNCDSIIVSILEVAYRVVESTEHNLSNKA